MLCTGSLCFVCERDGNERIGYDKSQCDRCSSDSILNGAELLKHMSAHILYDKQLTGKTDLCGFCLQSTCEFFLTKKRDTKQEHQQIDMKASRCPKMAKIAYKSASECSQSNPCTNVPIYCPLCHPRSPAVWKYNMEHHIRLVHSEANVGLYQALWEIEGEEREGMAVVWQRITNSHKTVQKNRSKKVKKSKNYSEVHSSQLALRYYCCCCC